MYLKFILAVATLSASCSYAAINPDERIGPADAGDLLIASNPSTYSLDDRAGTVGLSPTLETAGVEPETEDFIGEWKRKLTFYMPSGTVFQISGSDNSSLISAVTIGEDLAADTVELFIELFGEGAWVDQFEGSEQMEPVRVSNIKPIGAPVVEAFANGGGVGLIYAETGTILIFPKGTGPFDRQDADDVKVTAEGSAVHRIGEGTKPLIVADYVRALGKRSDQDEDAQAGPGQGTVYDPAAQASAEGAAGTLKDDVVLSDRSGMFEEHLPKVKVESNFDVAGVEESTGTHKRLFPDDDAKAEPGQGSFQEATLTDDKGRAVNKAGADLI